jgi:hypothetical protein
MDEVPNALKTICLAVAASNGANKNALAESENMEEAARLESVQAVRFPHNILLVGDHVSSVNLPKLLYHLPDNLKHLENGCRVRVF